MRIIFRYLFSLTVTDCFVQTVIYFWLQSHSPLYTRSVFQFFNTVHVSSIAYQFKMHIVYVNLIRLSNHQAK